MKPAAQELSPRFGLRSWRFPFSDDARSTSSRSRLFGVRVAREDGERAVELFREHGTRKLVGKRERRQRKFLRRATTKSFGKTLRAAAQKNNFARATIAGFTQPLGELRRVLTLPAVIEQDNRSR